jgi:hypothetical protein
MAVDLLRNLIDAVRRLIHEELEVQLGAMAETHTRAVAEARQAADADAEQRWSARLESARSESQQRLEPELDRHRQRASELESELAAARSEVERLAVESSRARENADRVAIEAAAAARRQVEDSFGVERQRLEAQLAAERRRASELEINQQSAAAELDRQRRRVSELEAERQRAQAATPVAGGDVDRPSRLLDAIRALDEARTLTDVLAATVTGAAVEAPRAALFVAHGGELREWPVAGVPSLDPGSLRLDDAGAGVIGEALRSRRPVATHAGNGSAAPAFARLRTEATALAVPLVLGGIPVAVLYADEGSDGHAGGLWQRNVETLGRHAATCAASLTAVRTAQAMRLMSAGDAAAGGEVSDSGPDEVQAARRYARLLVSEIKLYNESAVRLGRERRDLLLRLEPEIGRARRLYDERVAASVSGRETLFQQELAQTLADGDHSLLGTPGQPSSW